MAATITVQRKYKRAGIEYGELKISVPTADVLTLNSVPISLVSAPGSGKAVRATNGFGRIATYGGAAYATNTTMLIGHSAATNPQLISTLLLPLTTAKGVAFTSPAGDVVENSALLLSVDSGDPTAGNSNLLFYVSYMIVNL